jgi:hypothetical protein
VWRWRFANPGRPSKALAISLKCVANNTIAYTLSPHKTLFFMKGLEIPPARTRDLGTLLSTKAPQIAKEIANPSVELVPLPSSSTITKLDLEILVKINAISRISLEKLLTLNSIPSSTEIRVNNCSNIGNEAYSAGTLSITTYHKEKTQQEGQDMPIQ